MQYIFALIGFCVLVGAFSLGFKLSRFLHERRKNRAFEYLRQVGAYPPIYTGYGQPQPQPTPQTRNGATVDHVSGVLYICVWLSIIYACWCGLTWPTTRASQKPRPFRGTRLFLFAPVRIWWKIMITNKIWGAMVPSSGKSAPYTRKHAKR